MARKKHISDNGHIRPCDAKKPEDCKFIGGQFNSAKEARESDAYKELVGADNIIPGLKKKIAANTNVSKIEEADEDNLNDDEKLLAGLSSDYSGFNDDEDEDSVEVITPAKTKPRVEKTTPTETKTESPKKPKVAEPVEAHKKPEVSNPKPSNDGYTRDSGGHVDWKKAAKDANLTKPTTITLQTADRKEAELNVLYSYTNERSSDKMWKEHMEADGKKRNRTDANMAEFYEKVAVVAKADKDFNYDERLNNYTKRAILQTRFENEYLEGAESGMNKQFFDKRWNLPDPALHGKTAEQYWNDRVKEVQDMRTAFEKGELTPGKIVGSGYRNPKKMAADYLDREEKKAQRIINSKGRADTLFLGRAGLAPF